jgi:hypothetical protein
MHPLKELLSVAKEKEGGMRKEEPTRPRGLEGKDACATRGNDALTKEIVLVTRAIGVCVERA